MSAYVEVWFGDHVFSADAVTIPNETAEVTYKVERWIGGRAGDAEEAADSAVVERDDFLAMLEVIKTASERPARLERALQRGALQGAGGHAAALDGRRIRRRSSRLGEGLGGGGQRAMITYAANWTPPDAVLARRWPASSPLPHPGAPDRSQAGCEPSTRHKRAGRVR